MIGIATRASLIAATLALSACASAPLHYYTLVPSAASAAPAVVGAAGLPFQLSPVSVPAQVDQPQLVVREGNQSVVLLNGERWIAPLADEVRSALSADLMRDLRSQDVSGLSGNDRPTLRIKLDLHRFDSQPGSYALIEGVWSVRVLHGGGSQTPALSCSSRIRESVEPGFDALVQGHQRALATLAEGIATVARQLGSGQAAHCPAS